MKYIFHEVRTPLNSLVMGIEILKQSRTNNITDVDVSLNNYIYINVALKLT
jgi:signal transduction histidine kinase